MTWTSSTSEFQILSAACEDVPGMAITTPVPEPSIVALLGLGAVALAFRRRRTG